MGWPIAGEPKDMIVVPPRSANSHRSDALQIIADAAQTYPDSRNLALNHAELLARCGHDTRALAACESFLVRFGADESLLALALNLRTQFGVYDRLPDAGKQSISLCMIVKNEEKHLARCLSSARPVVHEIIVVDTGSSDRTTDIATVFGARLSRFAWNGNFSDARNYAIEQATGCWILVLDADEVLSERDHSLVSELVRSSGRATCAWSVLTRNYTSRVTTQEWTANDGVYPAEETSDGWFPSWKVRLFPRQPAIRFSGEVHEMVETSLRSSGYRIQKAPFVVHHYGELASHGPDPVKQRHYFELGKQKLKEDPENIVALVELALQAGELGSFEEALALWDRVQALRPDVPETLFNMGYALMGLRRYAEALIVSKKALELEPTYKEAAYNYGTCELYDGDPERALALIKPLADRNHDYPPLQALMAVLCFACNIPGEGEKKIEKLKASGYGIDTYIKERLSVLEELGRYELADTIRLRNISPSV